MRKPEDRFFNLILNENNLIAGETLFIDDTHTNTDAAEKLGINGYYLKQGEDILNLLKYNNFKALFKPINYRKNQGVFNKKRLLPRHMNFRNCIYMFEQ